MPPRDRHDPRKTGHPSVYRRRAWCEPFLRILVDPEIDASSGSAIFAARSQNSSSKRARLNPLGATLARGKDIGAAHGPAPPGDACARQEHGVYERRLRSEMLARGKDLAGRAPPPRRCLREAKTSACASGAFTRRCLREAKTSTRRAPPPRRCLREARTWRVRAAPSLGDACARQRPRGARSSSSEMLARGKNMAGTSGAFARRCLREAKTSRGASSSSEMLARGKNMAGTSGAFARRCLREAKTSRGALLLLGDACAKQRPRMCQRRLRSEMLARGKDLAGRAPPPRRCLREAKTSRVPAAPSLGDACAKQRPRGGALLLLLGDACARQEHSVCGRRPLRSEMLARSKNTACAAGGLRTEMLARGKDLAEADSWAGLGCFSKQGRRGGVLGYRLPFNDDTRASTESGSTWSSGVASVPPIADALTTTPIADALTTTLRPTCGGSWVVGG